MSLGLPDRGHWIVRHEGTGCRVGRLNLAIRGPWLEVHHFRPCLPMWREDDIGDDDLRIEDITGRVDHEKGVVWVERAADLHGLDGFTLDD